MVKPRKVVTYRKKFGQIQMHAYYLCLLSWCAAGIIFLIDPHPNIVLITCLVLLIVGGVAFLLIFRNASKHIELHVQREKTQPPLTL